MGMTIDRGRTAVLLVVLGAALTGCTSPAPAPQSVEPVVDSAVLATLPDGFVSVTAVRDEDAGECVTTVTTTGVRGISAAAAEDAVGLLKEGAEQLGCVAVLRLVDDEGREADISHLAQDLPVEARGGEVVIR